MWVLTSTNFLWKNFSCSERALATSSFLCTQRLPFLCQEHQHTHNNRWQIVIRKTHQSLKWQAAPWCLPRWGQKYPIDGSKRWQGHKYRYDPCHEAIQAVSKCLWKQQNISNNVALLYTCQFRCWKGANQEKNSDFDFSCLLNVYIGPLYHCYQHWYNSPYFIQLKQYHYHVIKWD
jgi:hypothetical protein